MNLTAFKRNTLIFVCHILCLGICENGIAQKIKYSSGNVLTGYPDQLQLVANIADHHHLLSFIEKEEPAIFVYDNDMKYLGKNTIPFKFPDKSETRIIPFDNFYYLYIHPPFTSKYLFWKVDANGSFTELTAAFQNLLQSQSQNIKLGFQLINNQGQLCMLYHTDLTNLKKNTLIIAQTDTLLKAVFTHKLVYDFKREEEKLQQEVLMSGKYLFVLKTAVGGTSLELMKVNLATGYTIRNTFQSSGYLYSQSTFSYNNTDSTATVTSLLTEPRVNSRPKSFVFVCRLNKILIEQVPFTILRSQFLKNTSTNFLLVNSLSRWVRLKPERYQSYTTVDEQMTTSSRDYSVLDPNNSIRTIIAPVRNYTGSEEPGQSILFSLLDKNFKITSDSLVSNTKNSYTIKTDQFTRFAAGNKEYLLVGQLFSRKNTGLLMINTNDADQLTYTDVRVNDRNNYLLSKAKIIPRKGIIIPYTYKRELGLIKFTIE